MLNPDFIQISHAMQNPNRHRFYKLAKEEPRLDRGELFFITTTEKMPRVAYSPEEIEPILLGKRSFYTLLIQLRVELLLIEAEHGDKEELSTLKSIIDKVLILYIRTNEALQQEARTCPTTTL